MIDYLACETIYNLFPLLRRIMTADAPYQVMWRMS
jgi:hypothetical protein